MDNEGLPDDGIYHPIIALLSEKIEFLLDLRSDIRHNFYTKFHCNGNRFLRQCNITVRHGRNRTLCNRIFYFFNLGIKDKRFQIKPTVDIHCPVWINYRYMPDWRKFSF